MYRIPYENEQITKTIATPYAPVDFTEEEKEQFRENIGAIGGSGGGSSVVVNDEFISKISTYNQLAKIKKLTGKSVVQNNAIVDAAIKGFGSTGKNLFGLSNSTANIVGSSAATKRTFEYDTIYNGLAYNNYGAMYSTYGFDGDKLTVTNNNIYGIAMRIRTVVGNLYVPYFESKTGNGNAYLLDYAEDGTYIRSTQVGFIATEGHVYVALFAASSDTTIYIKPAVLVQGQTYEPYSPYYRNFPIVLRSAGSVADEVEDIGSGYKVTRRIGTKNADDYSWTQGTGSWYTGVGDLMKFGTNVLCAQGSAQVYANKNLIVISETRPTGIINFELPTPIVEYHNYNLTYPVTEGGTEYFDSPVAVPCTIEYGVDIINDIVAGVIGGDTERDNGSYDLLWENASPSSDFAGQIVNIDLARYRAVLINFGAYKNATIGNTYGVFALGKVGEYGVATLMIDGRTYNRPFNVSTSGVNLLNAMYYSTYGSSSSTANNSYLIPFRIYGIK